MVRQQRTHGPRALQKVSTMATIGTLEKSSFTSYTSGRLPGTTQLCYKRRSSQQPWRANFLGVFQEQIKSVFQILFPKRRLQWDIQKAPNNLPHPWCPGPDLEAPLRHPEKIFPPVREDTIALGHVGSPSELTASPHLLLLVSAIILSLVYLLKNSQVHSKVRSTDERHRLSPVEGKWINCPDEKTKHSSHFSRVGLL